MDVPPQDVITRDNVPARVNAVIYFRVVDPNKSVIEVENHVLATSQISQTTLRSVLGQKDLDDLLTNRESINEELQSIIDEQTDPWGIKVSVVEVKDVEIPQQMQRAMARQAESERERRAKIIAAEGEYQASQRLRQAADRLESPTALQLRLFQTMGEIAVNQNSTIILPVPIDLCDPSWSQPRCRRSVLLRTGGQGGTAPGGERGGTPIRRGRRRRPRRGIQRRGADRDARRRSQPLERGTHGPLPQGTFFPPQLPPLGRRKQTERINAHARNRFKDFYSLRRTYPSPDDPCQFKGSYGGFEGDTGAAPDTRRRLTRI